MSKIIDMKKPVFVCNEVTYYNDFVGEAVDAPWGCVKFYHIKVIYKGKSCVYCLPVVEKFYDIDINIDPCAVNEGMDPDTENFGIGDNNLIDWLEKHVANKCKEIFNNSDYEYQKKIFTYWWNGECCFDYENNFMSSEFTIEECSDENDEDFWNDFILNFVGYKSNTDIRFNYKTSSFIK